MAKKRINFEIDGKNVDVYFGLDFLDEIDKKFSPKEGGQSLGLGLQITLPTLLSGNVKMLAEYIYNGTVTESPRPSFDAIKNYLEEVDDIEKVFDEVISLLGESNATVISYRDIEKKMKKAK